MALSHVNVALREHHDEICLNRARSQDMWYKFGSQVQVILTLGVNKECF
jgi:hypothetical protein